MIAPVTASYKRQVWMEGPKSTKLKYNYLKEKGYRGFGAWTADAVGAVDEYWWGNGCSGNSSIPVCPMDTKKTAQFAAEMWAAVPSRV